MYIVDTLQKYLLSAIPSSISRDTLSDKTNKVAGGILKIGMVSAVAWGCRTVNAHATFFGFTLGSCFSYSPVRKILKDFSFNRLSDTPHVAQAVMMLIAKIAPDLIPWGITFTVFGAATVVGIYTRELITPRENQTRKTMKSDNGNTRILLSQSTSFRQKISEVPAKDFTSKIYSVALSSLVVFIKAFIPTLLNWTISWYSPNVSPFGFWYGFILHRFAVKQWKNLKKHNLNPNLLSIIGGIGITTIVCYPKKEHVQTVAFFTLSAMMGKYTYSVMYKES